MMRKVFVSGCYDVLHGGHLEFFEDAKSLGDHLTVSVATDAVLMQYKGRPPSLPLDHKMALIGALRPVDQVVPSSNLDPIFDFRDVILRVRPNVLAVTEDDPYQEEKGRFCIQHGIELVVLPKRNVLSPISTTSILTGIRDQTKVPLRVDFAGGWLDVPKLAREGGYIVNCSIQPLVTLDDWPYEIGSGLGGSAAKAILEARNGIRPELAAGAGWQDPAVIEETGLCVWRSGALPMLDLKLNPEWLQGRILLYWTGSSHHTPDIVDMERDYNLIFEAGRIAKQAAERRDLPMLAQAIQLTYQTQIGEGMKVLPDLGALATKYLGAGHGGYALYLFANQETRYAAQSERTKIVEPYLRTPRADT
jgi:cytidyltransferase-like protein